MTRQFEVTHRDGAARLGTLRWRGDALSTPSCFKSKGDLEFLKDSTRNEADVDINIVENDEKRHAERANVDIIILAAAARFRNNPLGLTKALLGARATANPDAALYVPAFATPQNVSILVYAGVDLVDFIIADVKAREGYFLDQDGERHFSAIARRPCSCRECDCINVAELSFEQIVESATNHNKNALQQELSKVGEYIERGALRELVEARCRSQPTLTALLRLLDDEHEYFELRSPIVRTTTLLACSQESLNRPEIRRFSRRVTERLRKREGLLLLLPCSARKPYSRSRSHKIILTHLGKLRTHLNEAIISSPIGVVPRSLEIMYPASDYDVPVTGTWTCDERQWVSDCLAQYLSTNAFGSVVAHVSGPYRDICDVASESTGIEMVYPVEDESILSSASLQRLRTVVTELTEKRADSPRDLRFDYIRDLTDYQFGRHASEAVFPQTPKTRGIFPFYYATESGRRIATITGRYRTLALTLEGARRYLRTSGGRYTVEIDDFEPKGTIFAIGVVRADPGIRPFDEVIICNDSIIGVGRALMSGWEMEGSKNGGAVAVRHVESR